MDCHLLDGSSARHPLITSLRTDSVWEWDDDIPEAESLPTHVSPVDEFSARSTGCPVIISYVSMPKAKISVRASVSRPSICSGAIYANVPDVECKLKRYVRRSFTPGCPPG